ncbi:DUF7289 family protein [Halorientalis pallida]|uniref:Uncharacterized protein n=1 Tax=Halorientalis pallida TaxID=2479928 RepID=A0A498L085_9EURY|nr:hypothetical protein [Halorientalis pallida]RXK51729.1 hypothetical protein EAF64_03605 [Halorientalis pallida]
MTDQRDTTDGQHPTTSAATRSRLRTDRRGVSEVVGTLLMFGLLVLLLVLVQVNAVPAANQQVEFEHDQRVQGDLQELQEAILLTASTGREGVVSVETGTGYPSRLFLFNPPRASGTIERTAVGTVEVRNALATGDTGDYVDGTLLSFESGGLAYRPNYNEYGGAPTTVYENGVLYSNFTGNRSVIQERGAIVSGRDLSLVALQGTLATSSSRSVSVGVTPLSAPTRTVSVTNVAPGDPVTITVPTRLGPDAWRALLEEEREANGGHVTRIERASSSTVRITLAEGVVYDLRIAAVGVGTGFDRSTDAAYITTVSGNGSTVPEDGSHQVVAEVRDAYNNPVSNETVSAEVVQGGGTVLVVGTDRTDDDGRSTLEYTADGINSPLEDVVVDVWIGDGSATPSDPARVSEFSLTVFDVDGTGQTGGTPGGNPVNPGINLQLTGAQAVGSGQCNSRNGCDAAVTVTNRNAQTGWTVEELRVSVYAAQGDGGPTSYVVSDTRGASGTTLFVGADFTPAPLDDFGPDGASDDQQTYYFDFAGFSTPQDGVRTGDTFVLEVVYEDDDGTPTVVTYFVPVS